MKKMILIDGNAILHRAYHSIPPFKTRSGLVTNAIYGFMRMLFDIYKKEKPDYLGIAWDRAAKTFRHEEFKEYKAQRAAPPDDLYPQLPRLKEILKDFNIPMEEADGSEADDLLGTIAACAEKENDVKIIIVTGDKDTFQLVNEKTHVMTPVIGLSKTETYDTQKVIEKLGIRPDQVIDYKALSGDPSDNIPGVPGIGPKGAVEMLKKYNDLDNIYAHLNELPAGQQKKLTECRESAYLSRRLVTIMHDCPITFNLDHYRTHKINYDRARQHFEELEFTSLIPKLEELKKSMNHVDESQQSLF
jgi:DNA polymerase I